MGSGIFKQLTNTYANELDFFLLHELKGEVQVVQLVCRHFGVLCVPPDLLLGEAFQQLDQQDAVTQVFGKVSNLVTTRLESVSQPVCKCRPLHEKVLAVNSSCNESFAWVDQWYL